VTLFRRGTIWWAYFVMDGIRHQISVAEAELEAVINRLACSGASRLQPDIGSIARINSDHSTG